MHRVTDRVACRIRSAIQEPTEWQHFGDEIGTATIFARADFVNVRLAICISVSRCGVDSKMTEFTRVNPRKAIIVILAAVSASLALADDFKTVNGKEYKDAKITLV